MKWDDGREMVNQSDRRWLRWQRPENEMETLKGWDKGGGVRRVTTGVEEEERCDGGLSLLTSWLKQRKGQRMRRRRIRGTEKKERTEDVKRTRRRNSNVSEEDKNQRKSEKTNNRKKKWGRDRGERRRRRASCSVWGPGLTKTSEIHRSIRPPVHDPLPPVWRQRQRAAMPSGSVIQPSSLHYDQSNSRQLHWGGDVEEVWGFRS